jgi:hypothetical protein
MTWSKANDENGGNRDAGRYIGIYFAFGIGYSVLVLLQTMILWLFCSLEVQFVTSMGKWLKRSGVAQAAREDGPCHLSQPDDFFRDDADRADSQPILEVSPTFESTRS